LITQAAENTGLDPILLASLIFVESRGDQGAISSQGAVGLMQIMPRDGKAASFMCINGPCFGNRPTTEELLDPRFNVEYGSNFLGGLISKYGLRDGLFRYGPENISYAEYADKIIGLAEMVGQ
jgi:soluble lytic murein transglycosylase-like protein